MVASRLQTRRFVIPQKRASCAAESAGAARSGKGTPVATDPIRGMTVEEFDTGFSTNLGATLRELAQLPPMLGAPYLTAYLSWRPEGTSPGRRAAPIILERELSRLRKRYEDEPDALASFDADAARINAFLENDLSPAVQGVIIVANHAGRVFEHVVLAIETPTVVSAAPTPALLELARIVEDHPRYAVLLADQHDATLSVFSRASRGQAVSIEGDDYPRKHKQGGWSQRRYQARADERVAHFARFVAEETRRALDEFNVDMLVVAGGEVITSALAPEFHQTVKKRIIATIPMDIRASEQDILVATKPLVDDAEHAREARAIQQLLDAIGQGGFGVSGADDVLVALQEGRVGQFLMTREFEATGWADYRMSVFGIGPAPKSHPAGGNVYDIVPVNLPEELVRLTIVTGAEGEIIARERAGALDELGGVGAVLRF
jgi:peptide chain release factor subunit 1